MFTRQIVTAVIALWSVGCAERTDDVFDDPWFDVSDANDALSAETAPLEQRVLADDATNEFVDPWFVSSPSSDNNLHSDDHISSTNDSSVIVENFFPYDAVLDQIHVADEESEVSSYANNDDNLSHLDLSQGGLVNGDSNWPPAEIDPINIFTDEHGNSLSAGLMRNLQQIAYTDHLVVNSQVGTTNAQQQSFLEMENDDYRAEENASRGSFDDYDENTEAVTNSNLQNHFE